MLPIVKNGLFLILVSMRALKNVLNNMCTWILWLNWVEQILIKYTAPVDQDLNQISARKKHSCIG